MLHLPPELWVTILSQCDAPTLKAVRLSDKRLSNLAALFLFAEIHVGLFRQSLEKLQGISEHTKLRYLVKRITFHDVYLYPYESLEEYEQDVGQKRPYLKQSGLLDTKDEWGLEDYDFSKDEIEYHYGRYQQYLHDQESWRRNAGDLSFQKCISKLDCLEVAKFPYYCPLYRNSFPFLRRLRCEILVMGERSTFFPQNGGERSIRELSILLEGLSMRSRRLQSTHAPLLELYLRIDEIDFWGPQVSDPETDIEAGTSNRLARMQPVFCNLQKLDCGIYGESMNAEDIAADMARFLGDAKQLRSLKLRIATDRKMRDSQTSRDLLEFFPSSQMWPTLNDLTLSLRTTENSLLQVLVNHSQSLKSLTLSNCILVRGGGSWRSLIARLPEVLDLKTVKLEQLFDDEFYGVSHGTGQECLFAWNRNRPGKLSSKARRRAFYEYILCGGPLPSFNIADFTEDHELGARADEGSYDDDSEICYSSE